MRTRCTDFAAAVLLASFQAIKMGAATLPPGFQETIVFSGLTRPTAVRFASDGRIFVAEKSGLIKVFDSLSSPTPTIFADLRTEIDDYWDRGLLGLALHPNFPATPYVYVLYSYDAPIGGTAPTWNDACPNPPGTANGCVISGRLSRLVAAGNVMTGTEEVLLEAWGQQFPSHSIGDLHFSPDGSLYVSGGDGAGFNGVDYGQYGIPKNPLGDPPLPVGTRLVPPGAEGGSLRSQSLRRAAGGPALTNGAILRVDDDGNALPDNPLFGSADPIAQRIVAYGLRNPFRFTIQPGTGALWIGDVGWSVWEEINRLANPTGAAVTNFGWPCYEGNGQQSGYLAANLSLCTDLYATPGGVTSPFYTYNHSNKLVPDDPNETCPTGSSSISGLAFYGTGSYPANYDGALFFGDYSRQCIWVMFPDAQGNPVASTRATFIAGAATPVDLQIGPGGDLYYADHAGGKIRRVQSFAPSALATAAPLSGPAPLSVQFDGSGSHAARPGDTITHAWDFEDNGTYEDSTLASPTFVYTQPGSHTARLRVTDNHGVSAVSDPLTVLVSGVAPTATIDSPSPILTWKVGDSIAFSGHATDPQDGSLPASALSWTLVIRHCPSNCHTHTIQSFPGVASGSFSTPDHEYPSFLELRLTAVNSKGVTHSRTITLQPQTVSLTFQSSPPGMSLIVATGGGTTPFVQTVIVGSEITIEASPTQTLGGIPYGFLSWSDGGPASHEILAGASPATYTVTYRAADLSVLAVSSSPEVCAGGALAFTLTAHNAGPTAASSVSVAATLPAGVSLQSASGDGWSCAGFPIVTCTRSNFSPGDAPAIVLSATAPAVAGPINVAVAVSAATSDPNASNNVTSAATNVNPLPSAVVSAPVSVCLAAAGADASVPDAGTGAAYSWSIENGAIASGQGTAAIRFTPGPSAGQPVVLQVTVATAAGCAVSDAASVPVILCPPEMTGITPTSGPASGAIAVTASGDHFEAGATVSIGGVPAGNVVVAGPTEITATAPPLPPGTLNDVVTSNPDGQSGELLRGYFADFTDVPASHGFHGGIEKIFRAGITAGCLPGDYCPDDLVDRTSMAVFLLRGRNGGGFQPPAATGDLFTDVPLGTDQGAWIEELSRQGITSGCSATEYCPGGLVSRATMAVFLLRAKHPPGYRPPAATGAVFTDVPLGMYLGDWIEQLSREGITTGCGGDKYCPAGLVTRGEMAVFLSRTFNLP
jgi:uncharacterized repeat protein (TIGR01451 family)